MSTTNEPPPQPPLTTRTSTAPPQFQVLGPQLNKIHYPLSSSGRGFIPTTTSGVSGGGGVGGAFSLMPNSGNHVNSRAHPPHSSLHHHHHPSTLSGPAGAVTAPRGGPFNHIHRSLPKVGSFPCTVPNSNAPINIMDKKLEDSLVTIRDRKVRVSDRTSLYALCRSWLRNGYPEEIRPQYGDGLMSLPRPSPLLEASSSFPKRKECDDETEVDEVDSNEALSAEELLARHVKRAKRVRARLREERTQRIEKYTSRLTLLLPTNGTIQEGHAK